MERLLEQMEKAGLEVMFISRPVNVKYVSGYTGDDSYLLITNHKKYFITDPRYMEQASIECPDYILTEWRSRGSVGKAVAEIAEKEELSAIGFEDGHMTVAEYRSFEAEVKAELAPFDGVIEGFRSVKRLEEIECLRAACDIASRSFDKIIKDIRIGTRKRSWRPGFPCIW